MINKGFLLVRNFDKYSGPTYDSENIMSYNSNSCYTVYNFVLGKNNCENVRRIRIFFR